jgi:hypothetical protein
MIFLIILRQSYSRKLCINISLSYYKKYNQEMQMHVDIKIIILLPEKSILCYLHSLLNSTQLNKNF